MPAACSVGLPAKGFTVTSGSAHNVRWAADGLSGSDRCAHFQADGASLILVTRFAVEAPPVLLVLVAGEHGTLRNDALNRGLKRPCHAVGLEYTIVTVTCGFAWQHGVVRRRSGIRV